MRSPSSLVTAHTQPKSAVCGKRTITCADDLAALIEALDLNDAILVGHSTGGGEVTRYIGRHGTSRVATAVLLGRSPR
jgi:non-heme chloroperoxidase